MCKFKIATESCCNKTLENILTKQPKKLVSGFEHGTRKNPFYGKCVFTFTIETPNEKTMLELSDIIMKILPKLYQGDIMFLSED